MLAVLYLHLAQSVSENTHVMECFLATKFAKNEFIMYSKISLSRPFTGVNSCGPFMEIVDLQNFPKYGQDTIL